jgi:ABC-2 type transport system ATP-binding protein
LPFFDQAAITVQSVSKAYGSTQILDDVSLALPPGARAGLVGANGAGKTTLLRIIAGLSSPSLGHVQLKTADTSRPNGSPVALVPQGKSVFSNLTADELMAIAAAVNKGLWDPGPVNGWLNGFDVPRDRLCGKLSGGERSHVSIALALGRRVPFLVMDEPFAELDPAAREDAVGALTEHLNATGQTLLISSHGLADIERLCDYLLVMSHGKITLAGSTEELAAAHPDQGLAETAMAALREPRRGTRTSRRS